MDLNIRQSNAGGKFHGRVFSVDPPEIRVDGIIKHDFYLTLVSISEALHSWTKETVSRGSFHGRKGEWIIQTKGGSRVLALKQKGRRLYVVGVKFSGSMKTFLESVEDRIDIDEELQGYNREVSERDITQRFEIPPSLIDQIEESKESFTEHPMFTLGEDPRLTPPPKPKRPVLTPDPDEWD